MIGFWICLGVFLACLVAGLALVAVRGLEAWRQLKRTRAAIGAEVGRIMETADAIQRQLEAAARSRGDLEGSLARLASSRGRLTVQLAAVAEAQWMLRRLLPFLPR